MKTTLALVTLVAPLSLGLACGSPGSGSGSGFPLPDGFGDTGSADATGSADTDKGLDGMEPDEDASVLPGDCEQGEKRCSAQGAIEVCIGDEWQSMLLCPDGTSCKGGECIPDGCVPSCGSRDCGSDGCGGNCGDCGVGFVCVAGFCEAEPCVPSCTGKECGSDGCGGSCGQCPGGWSCHGGVCEQDACVPNCAGKQCGSDGCGASCGTCLGGSTCSAAGQCVGTPAELTCIELLDCFAECEDDDQCANACAAQASNHALNEFNQYAICMTDNACATYLCVADACSSAFAQCAYEGAGTATCEDIWNCNSTCQNDACYDACAASGSAQAQAQYVATLMCLNQYCPTADLDCVTDAMNFECNSYFAACGS